jgi:lysophospholipase L1-like esterase
MNSMRLRAAVAGLALVAAAWAAAGATAAGNAHYYVSVGDSLAAGTQPNRSFTNEGYADQLYATLASKDPKLQLVKLGCPGETTQSMITGIQSPCPHQYGSQIGDVVVFLQQHSKDVRYITIDIGANDVLPCASTGFSPACIGPALGAIKVNVPLIMYDLRWASGRNIATAGMNYYNPFLALYGSNQALALASNALIVNTFNPLLETSYTAAGAKVADVETAFSTTDFTPVNGVPLNVGRICSWTWMCTPFQNIHPNKTGYGVIAGAFEAVLK